MSNLLMELVWRLATASLLLGVAGGVALVMLRLFRVRSPRAHAVVWWLVLLQGVLLFEIQIDVPWLERVSTARSANETVSMAQMELPTPSRNRQINASSPGSIASTSDLVDRPAGLPWPIVLLAVWGGGVAFIFCRWTWHYSRFLRDCCGEVCDNPQWTREWKSLLADSNVDRAVALYVSSAAGPILCGSLTGYRLVVPFRLWKTLSEPQRRLIMRHELAHFARFDVWKSFVAHLLATIHWINPVAWLASRRIEISSEWACDDAVANAAGEASATYAKTLLAIAEGTVGKPVWKPAASGGCLSTRIRRILSSDVNKDSKMKTTMPIVLLLVLALINIVRIELTAQEPNASKPRQVRTIADADETGESRLAQLVQEHRDPAMLWSDGHKYGGVCDVAFSPDGKLLATGSFHDERTKKHPADVLIPKGVSPDYAKRIRRRGGEAKIWDAETGELKATLRGHVDCIRSVAFSPDGKTLATSNTTLLRSGLGLDRCPRDDFCVVKLWDVKTGKERLTLKGSPYWIPSIAFSPDGKSLASASFDGTVIVWDTQTGEQRIGFDAQQEQLKEVTFSPDGRALAVGGYQGGVTFWNPQNGRQLGDIQLASSCDALAFSPDGKLLAAGLFHDNREGSAVDTTVQVWEVSSLGDPISAVLTSEKSKFEQHTHIIQCLSFSPDGKHVASASGDKTVRLFAAATGDEIVVLKEHSANVAAVAFSPNGKRLATGSWDKSVILWDVSDISKRDSDK